MAEPQTLERPLDLGRLPNLWDFYDLTEEHYVPCNSARRFLMLFLSERTVSVEIAEQGVGAGLGKASLLIRGPMTDDEGHLKAEYTLTREEVDALSQAERIALRDRIRTKRLARDSAGIQTRKVLDELGLPRV